MNDFYSSSSIVLAHGIDMSANGGIGLLIVMTLFVLGLFVYRKNTRIPKALFTSSVISWLLVLISILIFFFKIQVPDVVGNLWVIAIWCPNALINGAFGMGAGFFLAAFIIDTLCIFAIIRLILYIKGKISAKKSQTEDAV
jgi:membrane-associated HD superfamily phosphohydrolase